MLLSVTPTNYCAKEPRCPYCYLSQRAQETSFEVLSKQMKELIELHQPEVVTFAYNQGYSPELFGILLEKASRTAKVAVTLQPECNSLFGKDILPMIDYVAFSYNTSNYQMAKLDLLASELRLKKPNLKIGINFLMYELPQLQELFDFFRTYQKFFEQFHFLIPKLYQLPYALKEVVIIVKTLKMFFPKQVFIDECLQTVITRTPCSREGKLLSLNADASVTKCSFASLEDQKSVVERCPYLVERSLAGLAFL